MENGEPLWDPKKDGRKLRLPKTEISQLNKNDEKANTNNEMSHITVIPPGKSKLNVEANEFVPKCYLDMSQNSSSVPLKSLGFSVQNRLKKHKDTQNASLNHSHGDNSFEASSNDDSLDFRRLKQLISTLTNDPGQFDNLSDIFNQTLLSYSNGHKDKEALSEVIELLVKEAIQHQSFRYTAARLCYSLNSLDFTIELCVICKRELESNVNKQGIVMFVSELYAQPHNQRVYGKCLTDSFKTLLDEGGDNNLKCVCQALKLTGYLLEIHDKDALDGVMEKLINIKQKQVATGTALCLLDSVLNLRNSKWGYDQRELQSLEDENWENYEEETISTDTVFYNSDGNKLTNEETAFLAANLQSTDEYLLDSSDPDELCDPEPEMDEEIQQAFKEFVKLSKR